MFELNELTGVFPLTGILFGRPSHLVVDFGAGLLCALAAWRQSGPDRVAWLLVAVGIICWAAGDVYWTAVLSDKDDIPVPSAADFGYLAFPLLAFAGLARVLGARMQGAPKRLWVDGVTASLATAAVAAALVVPGIVDLIGGDWKSVATNAAYPLSDLILLGLVVGAMAVRGWRLDWTWVLAGVGIVSFWAADSHYLIAVAQGGGGFPDPWDAGWDFAFLALACAAAVPARAAVAVAGRAGRRGTILPLVFGAMALGVLVYAGLGTVTPVAVVLAGLALFAVGVRLFIAFRENASMLAATRREALTDALTGLGNRRALTQDLERMLARATEDDPVVLVLFDLDGFKHYNDCYGHPAGDDLLVRLGGNLARRVAGHGEAYRMGGDEFCALLRPRLARARLVAAHAATALRERGEGFDIGSSHGFVIAPVEVDDPAEALRLADQRMYAQKHGGRPSAGSQSRDVLLRALAERNPDLGEHLSTVADLAVAVAVKLGLSASEVEQVRHAADLHDVGKVAIPDAILDKPGPLDDEEWVFMRRHTVIGERIVAAAPALREVATLVRASHERHDGGGYPDGLAGQAIPLGARIVAVCDSFDAMVADRPYRAAVPRAVALAELERCAGAQFDPVVVAAFRAALAELMTTDALPRAA
ncbi:HD domain-containing phosphohydrolase [Baekduia alba]|uniref:HD domain-containing phosphohydrolase n=1 Tax=Baekduia alba TaxID=2997333 RepID=UPI00234270D6|nr:HD domain-containing phosphohydrolase [Baekduia alba]